MVLDLKGIRGKMTLTIEIPEIASNIQEWSYWVKARDKYTCQQCGYIQDSIKRIHAHHISQDIQLRLTVSNGIALCHHCHITNHIYSRLHSKVAIKRHKNFLSKASIGTVFEANLNFLRRLFGKTIVDKWLNKRVAESSKK